MFKNIILNLQHILLHHILFLHQHFLFSNFLHRHLFLNHQLLHELLLFPAVALYQVRFFSTRNKKPLRKYFQKNLSFFISSIYLKILLRLFEIFTIFVRGKVKLCLAKVTCFGCNVYPLCSSEAKLLLKTRHFRPP